MTYRELRIELHRLGNKDLDATVKLEDGTPIIGVAFTFNCNQYQLDQGFYEGSPQLVTGS